MKNKKAQMKISQMAFMLIAVTIFFIMVGMFLLSIRLNSLRETRAQLEQENAILLASKIANSPELACGEAFGSQRVNCIDFDKAMMLKNNIHKYGDFWGVSNLEIRVVFPYNRNMYCGLEDFCGESRIDCDTILLVNKPAFGYDVSTFVTICRKKKVGDTLMTECNLGKIFVRYEEPKQGK